MNDDEQFEQRLQRQPLRKVPPAWREEVLRAAGAVTPDHTLRTSPPVSWWRELFWPCPQAWAALATVWLLILGLSFVSRESSPQALARHATLPSLEMRELLKQQNQLFAELVEPREEPQADQPKPVGHQPRSSRRKECFNA